jgi:hypothetical protein
MQSTLDVRTLQTIQDGFRATRAERAAMLDFVRAGGIYSLPLDSSTNTARQRCILIERVADGTLYVADGLHRVVSVLLGRNPPLLWPKEFTVREVTYQMYAEIDPAGGWITPFDPRIEVRFANLATFKRDVSDIIKGGSDPSAFIRSHKHLYCRPRTPDDTIASLGLRWCCGGDL